MVLMLNNLQLSLNQTHLSSTKEFKRVILAFFSIQHLENYNEQVNRVFSSYLTASATYMEKLYGEDNKLPLSNISFKSSRDYEVPKSGESLLAYFIEFILKILTVGQFLRNVFGILFKKIVISCGFCFEKFLYPRNIQLIVFQPLGLQTF